MSARRTGASDEAEPPYSDGMHATLRLALVAAIAAASPVAASPAAADGTHAELPRVFLDTRHVPPAGEIIRVRAGDDLQAALDERPEAAAFFATLTAANRYAILYRIGAVKKPETRARKIADFIAMLERGQAVHG